MYNLCIVGAIVTHSLFIDWDGTYLKQCRLEMIQTTLPTPYRALRWLETPHRVKAHHEITPILS